MIDVSVIVPVKNEDKYLDKLIQDILNQDYDLKKTEIIFADGNSTDHTKDIINRYSEKYPKLIKYFLNNRENAPSGVNLAIKNSTGKYIIRLDAHASYPSNYISKNIFYLMTTDADNVGCLIKTVGVGFVGESIAYILSTKFGVGDSQFRTNGKSGYVDTVPFGCFRKTIFDELGLFDETLPRSEDNEFNSRIIKSGGKIYLFNDIQTEYYSRNNMKSLYKMAFQNGKGVIQAEKKVKNTMRIRHLIPLLFYVSVIVGIIAIAFDLYIIKTVFLLEITIYGILDILFSLKSIKLYDFMHFIFCIILYPLFHLSYGFGSFIELILFNKKK